MHIIFKVDQAAALKAGDGHDATQYGVDTDGQRCRSEAPLLLERPGASRRPASTMTKYDVTEMPTETLYDSDTNDSVTAEDLGCSDDEYAAAVAESLAAYGEGHIRVNGRRVYAS